MSDFDVVIVGARVAGSALALRLARAGVRVCVLDRATFPSPTISTHVMHSVRPLRDLGVLDDVLACGAPLLTETRFDLQGVEMTLSQADDPGLCLRRESLDTVLANAASAAGAEIRLGHRVVEVLRGTGHGNGTGTVRGVVTQEPGGARRELTATIVVGADGRNSTVGRAVGAGRYLVTAGPRPALFGYFEGVSAPPALIWHRPGDHLVAGAPTDAGLYLVLAQPSPDVAARLRADEGHLLGKLIGEASPTLGALLDGATAVGEVHRMPGYQCYFRESAGDGWALIGDAGHFKDVTAGQGINDALRQAECLAGVLLYGLSRPAHLRGALHAYWVWRDADARDIYWFAQDLGMPGRLPELVADMLRDVSRRAATRDGLHEVLAHRRRPDSVLSPRRLITATIANVLHGPLSARDALTQMASIAGTDFGRRLTLLRRGSVAPTVPTHSKSTPSEATGHPHLPG